MPRTVALWIILLILTTVTVTWGVVAEAAEDNCVLSFVVPRDKMKSSCELDDKVNRRLNSLEVKVNLYKQEVADLHLLLEKERQLNADKLARLEQKFKFQSADDEVNMLVNNRLDNLEKTLDQIQPDLTTVTKLRHGSWSDEKSGIPFNTIDTNPDTTHAFIKSLVQSEMKSIVENLTKKFETYVQAQVLLYNQLFRMYPKKTDSENSHTTVPTVNLKDKAKTIAPEKKPIMLNDKGMQTDLQKVLSKVEGTGDEIAKHVGSYIKNMTMAQEESPTKESPTKESPANESTATESLTELNTTVDYLDISLTNTSEIILKDDLSEANDTFSGSNETEINNALRTEVRPLINKDITAARIGVQHSDTENSNTTATDSDHTYSINNSRKESDAEKDWKENMIRDQIDKQAEMEEKLRNEITAMLYSPLAEVFSIVEKKAAALEEKLKAQDDKTQQVIKSINSRVKELEQNIMPVTLQMESLSEGFQESFAKLDKIKPLEILINEIRKNITSGSMDRSASEFDEQIKKIKKMERLVGVYQQSLEHYRNETKVEYREIREIFEKEFHNLRTSSKILQENLTVVSSAIGMVNATLENKVGEIGKKISEFEHNIGVLNLDVLNLERANRNKTHRTKHDFEMMQRNMTEQASRQRDIRKAVDHLEQQMVALGGDLNATVKVVSDLKTEVKLNVLEEWLNLNFEYDASRTDCHGDQYVKKLNYKNARLVGVVLCSPTRYKIFLSNSLHSKFLNVGDNDGLGEDHCEFVGARSNSTIKLSPLRGPYFSQGFARGTWGQEPTLGSLNAIKPSPDWYECGVTIP